MKLRVNINGGEAMSKGFLDSAISSIQASVVPEVVSIGGKDYLSREVFLPPRDHPVVPIELNTLKGLFHYLTIDFDGIAGESLIHIASPTDIYLLGKVEGRLNQRPCYACVNHEPICGSFAFDRFMPIDQFTIVLQRLFEDVGDRAQVLALVGNIQSEIVQVRSDDGVTQSVQVREGVRRVAGVEIQNPVMLSPKRSFPEIDQIESPFILRLEKGESGDLPSVGLFECDGGLWRLHAISAIHEWLSDRLPSIPIIG